jgi:hypothetical protein
MPSAPSSDSFSSLYTLTLLPRLLPRLVLLLQAHPTRSAGTSLVAASAGAAADGAGAGGGAGAAGVGGWVDASLGKTLQGPDGEKNFHRIIQSYPTCVTRWDRTIRGLQSTAASSLHCRMASTLRYRVRGARHSWQSLTHGL